MKKINSKKFSKKITRILSSENLLDNSQKRCFNFSKKWNNCCGYTCNNECYKCTCCNCNSCTCCNDDDNGCNENNCTCCNNCAGNNCNNGNCCINCSCDYNCNNCSCCDNCDDAICEIIRSIALVESAISRILDAESEKVQKAIQLSNNVCELLDINNSVRNTIWDITELECMLSRKLESAISCMRGGYNNGCNIR